MQHFAAEPRVSHYLVAFESAVGGTQERVSFDAAGDVRRILRHYEPATWPFIAGVPATLVPVASGVLADGVIPASLADLRQMLTARGVPSRDVPVQPRRVRSDPRVGSARRQRTLRPQGDQRRQGQIVGGAALYRHRPFDSRHRLASPDRW